MFVTLPSTRLVLIAPIFAVLCVLPARAHAYDCGANPVLSTGNITLTENWTTNNATTACIRLQSGHDVNLNGYKITCTNASGCANAIGGVTGNTGSVVYDGKIEGPFNDAVRAFIDEVRSLTIDGADYAIHGAYFHKVHKNVLVNVRNGIVGGFTANNLDFASDNFVAVDPDALFPDGIGIDLVGGASGSQVGPQIKHNYVEGYRIGIQDWTFDNMRITENFIGEPGNENPAYIFRMNVDTSHGLKTITGNLCTDATYCPTPTPPFTLP